MEIEKNFSKENEARKSACSNRQDQSISITPLGTGGGSADYTQKVVRKLRIIAYKNERVSVTN
jgi:hypothetical protein